MKHTLYITLMAVLLFATHLSSSAQETPSETSGGETDNTKLIISSKNFDIFPESASPAVTVQLKAEYNVTTKVITLYFKNKDNERITFNSLNTGDFHARFIEKLAQYPNGKDVISFREYDIAKVYTWLYQLTVTDEDIETGTLRFRKWAVVFDNINQADKSKSEQRDSLIYVKSSAFQSQVNKLNGYAAQIQQYINNIDTPADRKVLDSAFKTRTLSESFITSNLGERFAATNDRQKIVGLVKNYNENQVLLKNMEDSIPLSNVYPVKRISVQFERGYIEKIQVWVENKYHETDIYENFYAIGFTSIRNFKNFSLIRLFNRKTSGANSKLIYLTDVIQNYDNLLQLYTRDYSPADFVQNNIDLTEQYPAITLKKEKNVRLLDTKIYSDLAGFAEDAPNGLVQIEAARRFNINTTRHNLRRSDYAIFTYLVLTGTLSKLENKDRILPLRNASLIQNNTIVSPSYATNLDLRRYENASIQVDLNGFLFDSPDNKLTAYIDAGVHYGHLKVADSTRQVKDGVITTTNVAPAFGANTVTFYPRFSVELFPERRIGLSAAYQINTTLLFSDNKFKQVASDVKSDLLNPANDKRARGSHMLEINARIETSKDGTGVVFARSRFFWQMGDANNFFPQIQIGYSYNILFKK